MNQDRCDVCGSTSYPTYNFPVLLREDDWACARCSDEMIRLAPVLTYLNIDVELLARVLKQYDSPDGL